jgi:hypothetical protein
MEVHAHTHTARKKWTHYLWEFLMLFLAVFSGFFAEYQLEHFIEKQREKKFALLLYEDFKKDTVFLNNVIHVKEWREKKFDSLFYFTRLPDLPSNATAIYYYSWFSSFSVFTSMEMKSGEIIRTDQNPPLQSYDPVLIKQLSLFAVYMNGSGRGIIQQVSELKQKGEIMIDYLQREYHLKR